MVRQAPVICVMVPPIHLGAWSMALMLWLPFELLLLLLLLSLVIDREANEKSIFERRVWTKETRGLPRTFVVWLSGNNHMI